jgi:hypothetical protein
MPAVSRSQRRLMGAAEHGAQFPLARTVRASMTPQQLHDFAATTETGLPQHVRRSGFTTPGRLADQITTMRTRGAFAPRRPVAAGRRPPIRPAYRPIAQAPLAQPPVFRPPSFTPSAPFGPPAYAGPRPRGAR